MQADPQVRTHAREHAGNHTDIQSDVAIMEQWQGIVDLMAQAMNVRSAIITHIKLPWGEVVKASRTEGNPYHGGLTVSDISGHYCEYVMRSGEPLVLPDARKSEHWRNAPEIKYDIISYMGYPIRTPGGGLFGTICVLDSKENHYSPVFQRLMEHFRALVEAHLALLAQRDELQQRLAEIQQLRGILPICACCKKIRNDSGYWEQVETYISARSEADFSHAFCPDCFEELKAAIPR